jgi:hypothetical protein
MSDIDRKLLELEIKGLKEIIDFHVKRIEILGENDEDRDIIDEVLEMIFDNMNKLNEL